MLEAEKTKKTIKGIMQSFMYSDKRCIVIKVSSKGTENEKTAAFKIKKYVADDNSLYFIIEMQVYSGEDLVVCEPILTTNMEEDIDDIAGEIAENLVTFDITMKAMGAKEIDASVLEDNSDIDALVDVRDLEREEIKKFLIKNNYRLYKILQNSDTNVPIHKLAEFLENCMSDSNIKGVGVRIDVKDIAVYELIMNKSELADYSGLSRTAGIISSDIIAEPFIFYCIDPSSDKLYDERAKQKVISSISNHLDHLVKMIKNKNEVDKIKVLCECTIHYKFEHVEGYYEY